MPSVITEKVFQLTIYLVKNNNAANEDLVKVGNAKPPVPFEISGAPATLYVRRRKTKTPDWTALLLQSADVQPSLFDENSSSGALLVVRLTDATFLVTFGLGHTLHNPEAIERDFGLRVALNSTKSSEIRSMDKATSELTPLNSRTQSSLGVDIEQLLRISVCPASCFGIVRPSDLFFVTPHFLTYFSRFSQTFFPLRFAC